VGPRRPNRVAVEEPQGRSADPALHQQAGAAPTLGSVVFPCRSRKSCGPDSPQRRKRRLRYLARPGLPILSTPYSETVQLEVLRPRRRGRHLGSIAAASSRTGPVLSESSHSETIPLVARSACRRSRQRGVSGFETPRPFLRYFIHSRQCEVIISRMSRLGRMVLWERFFFLSTAFRNYGDVLGLGICGPPHPGPHRR
jgi:hypothetical protein